MQNIQKAQLQSWRGGLVLLAIDWLECEYKKNRPNGRLFD
jgi:hypothetical protein